MPYAQQLRSLLERIAQTDDLATRRELIRQFGVALEQRLTQINSNNAAVVGQVENTLRDDLGSVAAQIKALELSLLKLQNTLTGEIQQNREATSAKNHQLSNFVMSLENKIDELAQLVMLDENER